MSKNRTVNVNYNYGTKRYGFWSFIGDVFMTCLTMGLWLIWVFIREIRGLRR